MECAMYSPSRLGVSGRGRCIYRFANIPTMRVPNRSSDAASNDASPQKYPNSRTAHDRGTCPRWWTAIALWRSSSRSMVCAPHPVNHGLPGGGIVPDIESPRRCPVGAWASTLSSMACDILSPVVLVGAAVIDEQNFYIRTVPDRGCSRGNEGR